MSHLHTHFSLTECMEEILMKEHRLLSQWTSSLRHPPPEANLDSLNSNTLENDPDFVPVAAGDEESIHSRKSSQETTDEDVGVTDSLAPFKRVLRVVNQCPPLLLNRLLLASLRRRVPNSFSWCVDNLNWRVSYPNFWPYTISLSVTYSIDYDRRSTRCCCD